MIVLGTEYYRPPNPEQVNWAEDLKKIKESGFSVIRTWLHWQQVNPVEGKWNFSNYDYLFKLAKENGIKILITEESIPLFNKNKIFISLEPRESKIIYC